MEKIIYIAGPVTDDPDHKWKFERAQTKLERQGYKVINPVKLAAALPETLTWKQIMEICLTAIAQADEAYFLEGWEESVGATAEFLACKGKIPVRYEKMKAKDMCNPKMEIPEFLKSYGRGQ